MRKTTTEDTNKDGGMLLVGTQGNQTERVSDEWPTASSRIDSLRRSWAEESLHPYAYTKLSVDPRSRARQRISYEERKDKRRGAADSEMLFHSWIGSVQERRLES
ncbi:hypothetical protein B296_00039926 [Ensete ventricosum]|uniref:Uncharacterized protein n=1 Tax=Ensete ventricosum TaxID=4639 RepID=A0A426ZM65_ENSVE|nr:hypothetical protein B296_00039926 [Ensete ventricosum]